MHLSNAEGTPTGEDTTLRKSSSAVDGEERHTTASNMDGRAALETPFGPAMDAHTPLDNDLAKVPVHHPTVRKPTRLSLPTRPLGQHTTRSKRLLARSTDSLALSDPVTPEEIETPVPSPIQAQRQKKRHRRTLAITPAIRLPMRGVQELSSEEPTNQSISLFDTISMLAVQPGEEEALQQDIFINNRVEDITRQETLLIPAMKIAVESEQQALQDKRKVVASTASGAAIAGIGDLMSAILRYGTTILMTNMFASSIYGAFVETNAVVTVLGYASKLGLDSATLRFLSTYRAKGERASAAGLIRFASLVALISGLIWGTAFFALSFTLAHVVFKKDVYALPFKEATLLVPLIGMQLVVASSLQAMKAIKWKVYVDRLIQPGLTLVLLIVFYLLGLRLEALILATTCGFLASTITGQFLLAKAKKNLVRGVKPKYDPKTWLRFAFPMFFNSMIRNILNSTDVLFLGAVATQSQIAYYGGADRVSYFVVAPLIALNAIFSPIIAEYHARGEYKQLETMFKVVTKWSFSLSLPIFLCCLIFHDAILGIFTEKYTTAGTVLTILALGNLVDSGVGSVNYLLVMTGRPKVILINTVTTVVVNITLASILVPRFNILGAALAAALTVIILNTVGLIEVYTIMKIHPYRRDIFKPMVAGGVASLIGFPLAQFIHVGYGHGAILKTLGLIIPFLLVYVSMLAILRFSEEDMMVFDMVRAKLSKGKKKAA